MAIRKAVFMMILLLFVGWSKAQKLTPGFDNDEFLELLRINAQLSETAVESGEVPNPATSRLLYSSPEIGLSNLWQLWLKDHNTVVIAIRGTARDNVSWLANLYAAQVPAKGTLEIDTNFIFEYALAEHPEAAVHAGYVFSTAFLAQDMLSRIDSCYQAGIRDLIITGHSQGGGLSYVLTAYLLNLQKQGEFPADMQIKTYACASPKPGNLYFAYEYESLTQNGWSFNVVSTEDWVPQTPFTVQTLSDLPGVSPVDGVLASIKRQSFFKRLAFRSIYRKAVGPSEKAVKRYQKYFGSFSAKNVRKVYPRFVEPTYAKGNEYVRAGAQIILYPDSVYYQKYTPSANSRNIMFHHSVMPYYYLFERYSLDK